MNRYFRYEHIGLWDEAAWEDRTSSVFALVQWLGEHQPADDVPYPRPVNGLYGEDCKSLPFYDRKTNSVNIPHVIDDWKARGIHYECRSQGGVHWLIMAPESCLADFGIKLPVLTVMHRGDLADPYWAMKTLDCFAAYNEMLAQSGDCILVYIVSSGPDNNRIYVNILQEALVFVPGDVKRMYLDIGTIYATGLCLRDIPALQGFEDIDAAVVRFGSAQIPALDITGRWENKCSLTRDQVSKPNWSSADFELGRLIHSETGRKMTEGMALELRFNSVYDPGFLQYWADMGLQYENRETRGRRWKAAVPIGAFEEPDKKLPVLCVMQEVNHSNEHLAVTEASYFYEYFRIAAQGECVLINFVLEDPDSNDLLSDILQEAFALYPTDQSRVYIAGHSHNGHYALEFAVRHPQLIAAVATFGDPPGLLDSGLTPVTEEKARRMAALDLPLINLAGCAEASRHFPLSSDADYFRPWQGKGSLVTFEERAASWQRRLCACNCPMKTIEEIAATVTSPEKAVRVLGVPGDRSETLWRDGFELHVVDVKNNAGKCHLRIVGEENMPHNTTPAQQELSWSFLRRFARDPETGGIQELY